MESLYFRIKRLLIEEYLYRFKGIELGGHIEKRMLRFQKKVERMMARRGISLIAYNLKEGGVSLSYVPEREWNHQKDVMNNLINQKGDVIGDKISEKTDEKAV